MDDAKTTLNFGLSLAGYSQRRTTNTNDETNLQRFVASYGVGHVTCSNIFNDICALCADEGKPPPRRADMFLMFLCWLKTNSTERNLAGIFGVVERTVHTWLTKYLSWFEALKIKKIILRITDEDIEAIFILSVDGTHCAIKEPRRQPDKLWFSHKLNKPGLAYEIALELYKNQIAWINGPFKAGESDLTLFRKEDGLKSKLPPGKLVIADKGYGNEDQISIPNELDSEELKSFKDRARSRHETVNGRIKEFRILSEQCRSYDLDRHGKIFNAVCVIIQYSMENDRPLMSL